jgi:molybdopterin-guanine dinucleotide biosynthesis protein A
MRRPKALLPWRGRPMVVHVAALLREAVDEVLVVSSAELELPALDARVVVDREPGLGPLAGIREGLAAARAELAYVTSTDAPLLSPAFVRTLLGFGRAAAPEVDGIVHVLSAAYPRALAGTADALLRQGRRQLLCLLEACGFRPVTASELPELDSLRGFNTPREYLAAVRADAPQARARLEIHRARPPQRLELEVPIGTLGEVLAHARPVLEPARGAPARYAVALAGRAPVCDPEMPIGAGERVVVTDRGGEG